MQITIQKANPWTSKLTGRNTHLTSHTFLQLEPQAPIVCDVAVECVQRSLKIGFFNETKNLRVKQKMMFEFQNFQHNFFMTLEIH